MNLTHHVTNLLVDLGWPTRVLAAGVDPMGRERGDYKTEVYSHGYETWSETCWSTDTSGPLLRSVVEGSSRHAPLFDVDAPVRVVSAGRGFTKVSVDAPVDRVRLRRRLRGLVRAGHVEPKFGQQMYHDLSDQIEAEGRHGAVSVYFAHPVRVRESKTPGHHHLYVDSIMSFRASVRLAKSLGFVDRNFIRASKRSRFWVVRPAVI